jgi:RNA polymerase sigma-70 factor, ECF subfamily
MSTARSSLKPAVSANQRELELLRLTAQGDREAFREIYLAYHRRLGRFLMRMTFRHDVIEEVINDTLWTVWRKAAEFRGESQVSTWIVGIAYRRALKALRASHAARTLPADDALQSVDPQCANEDREWLDRAMAELPFEQRMVLELSYLLGHSCEEISVIMQCPVNTVKTRMFHAREKLRASLPRLAGDDIEGGRAL